MRNRERHLQMPHAILVRMSRRTVIARVLFSLLVALHSYGSELEDVAARKAVVESMKSRQTGIGADCPKTRRKEPMEEQLFSLRSEKVVDGKLNENFLVYEVVEEGCYQVEDSSLVIYTIDHPGTYGYVAVNKLTRATYRLRQTRMQTRIQSAHR